VENRECVNNKCYRGHSEPAMYTDNVACKRSLKVGRMCCRIISVSSVEAGDSKHVSVSSLTRKSLKLAPALCGNRQGTEWTRSGLASQCHAREGHS
jgi:hypothetical protein